MTDVKLLALWAGWCSPCGTERPLALTESGHRGVVHVLRRVPRREREMRLACEVCGHWQVVDPEMEPEEEFPLWDVPTAAPAPPAADLVVERVDPLEPGGGAAAGTTAADVDSDVSPAVPQEVLEVQDVPEVRQTGAAGTAPVPGADVVLPVPRGVADGPVGSELAAVLELLSSGLDVARPAGPAA